MRAIEKAARDLFKTMYSFGSPTWEEADEESANIYRIAASAAILAFLDGVDPEEIVRTLTQRRHFYSREQISEIISALRAQAGETE